jgi:hypothetical protein
LPDRPTWAPVRRSTYSRGETANSSLARGSWRPTPPIGGLGLGRQRGHPAIELSDVKAVLLVQRDQPHRGGPPRLPVGAAGRAQDPRSVTAARIGTELERQPPVEQLDGVQADRVAQDPIGMTVRLLPDATWIAGRGRNPASAATDSSLSQSTHTTLARATRSSRRPPRRRRGTTPTNTSVERARPATSSTTPSIASTRANRCRIRDATE